MTSAGRRWDQRHRRGRRLVPRPHPRRRAGPGGVAAGLPGVGSVRPVRHDLGLPQAPRQRGPHPGQDRLAGQYPVRGRADLDAHRHRVLPAALRRASHGMDQPVRAGRHLRRDRRAGPVRLGRDQGGRAHVPAGPVPGPGVHRGQHRRPARCPGPGRHPVHADHLAAGDLAATARLQLQPDPVVGGHLHDPADRGLPPGRAGVGGCYPTGTGRGRSPPAAWRSPRPPSCCSSCCRSTSASSGSRCSSSCSRRAWGCSSPRTRPR